VEELLYGVNVLSAHGQIPRRIVTPHLRQGAVVADVIAHTVGVDVGVPLGRSGVPLGDGERLQDGDEFGLPPQVVDLTAPRAFSERVRATS
jgi:hypothetical protein